MQTGPPRFVAVHEVLEAPPHAGPLRGSVMAMGNFEGVHRGHRAVIAAAVSRARALGRPAAAVTFEPHPRAFFHPDEPLFRLTDTPAKLRLLATTGLDGAIVMKFDAALAALAPQEFVARVLMERLAVAGIAVGFDFRFGAARGGSAADLKEAGARLGFEVDVVPPLTDGGQRISSGAIRAALAAGHPDQAADWLGYPWFVTGTVVHGDRRGRELGYPTANLRLDPGCDLRHGVYAVRVALDGRRIDGVANFGRRPMFDAGIVLLEVHLFDFSGDLYGRSLDVAVISWIRPEFRFDTIDGLDSSNGRGFADRPHGARARRRRLPRTRRGNAARRRRRCERSDMTAFRAVIPMIRTPTWTHAIASHAGSPRAYG